MCRAKNNYRRLLFSWNGGNAFKCYTHVNVYCWGCLFDVDRVNRIILRLMDQLMLQHQTHRLKVTKQIALIETWKYSQLLSWVFDFVHSNWRHSLRPSVLSHCPSLFFFLSIQFILWKHILYFCNLKLWGKRKSFSEAWWKVYESMMRPVGTESVCGLSGCLELMNFTKAVRILLISLWTWWNEW